MNIDDPKLTAFALDELDEPERSTIAREVAESPDAQRVVDETRELARALKNGFAAETSRTDGFPAVIDENGDGRGDRYSLLDIRDDPWFWLRARPLAIAAAIAILGIVSAILIGNYQSQSDSRVPESFTVEGEPSFDGMASELAIPGKITSPWRDETIRRIERIVIGEIEREGDRPRELRIIEKITDGFRVERLKQRLANPVLSKAVKRGAAGHSYALFFLDRTGEIVASAIFCSMAQQGFVLQPAKNAYEKAGRYFIGGDAILPGQWNSEVNYSDYFLPFPDWDVCIGYAPGA